MGPAILCEIKPNRRRRIRTARSTLPESGLFAGGHKDPCLFLSD